MSVANIETFLRVVLTLIFCYATPSNFLVIQTILSNKELKTYNTLLYFAGIAFADTLAFFGYIQNAIWHPLFGTDIEQKYLVTCRLIAFYSRYGVQTSALLLTIATIDRCLLLYSKRWKLNYSRRPSLTFSIILIVFSIELLFHFHVLIYKGGYNTTTYNGSKTEQRNFACYLIKNLHYQSFYYSFYSKAHLILYSVLPYVITSICNIFVLLKVFHKRKQHIKTRTRSTQKNVTVLIVLSSTCYVLLTLPDAVYWEFFGKSVSNHLKRVIPYCINISLYINHSSTFLLLMIISTKFRQQLCVNMSGFYRKCFNNRIMPQVQISSKVNASIIISKVAASSKVPMSRTINAS
ncbi:unnamed protein product [Didymodactylos carnosus]|uniref:G-protein coupled receptors family 1 profile domain-containing protein n=1 Tax=Didymodactylos carnosus TaxID=1234261 RepID=A0A816ABE8_9BILA|nr:unnamed protein product [Didymodactylos carnosus]CAF1592875.1 unnamed protein product [Didymodactylos carnosus]CAF4344359.1 unnamed protein product [Didymodactylos carnosus]CAF4465896.1 unnamed protein product [Didymodactylos carnosus]